MLVPRHTLVRDLGMFAQVVQRIGRRCWVDSLGGIKRSFFGGLLLVAHSAVQDGEIIVRREIVRSDLLQRFILLQRVRILVLLIQSESKLTMRVTLVTTRSGSPITLGRSRRSSSRRVGPAAPSSG